MQLSTFPTFKVKQITLVMFALLTGDVALACKLALPSAERLNNIRPTIVTSSNRQFFLKLMPSRWAQVGRSIIRKKDSYGLAFEVLPDGQYKQLLSFRSWDNNDNSGNVFSKVKHPRFYLSNDGMNAVEVNFVKSKNDKTAVVMYTKGIQVKSLSPLDFGVNKLKVGRTSCRFRSWLEKVENRGVPYRPSSVELTTVNNVRWNISLDSFESAQAN